VGGRVCACRERGVSDDGLGVRVRVMRVSVDDSRLPQVAKAAVTQAIVVAGRQVAAQLIDRDLQDQLWVVAGQNRWRNEESRK